MYSEHAVDFDRWSADDYLHDYYSRVETEEEHTLEFLVKQCARVPVGSTILEFGCGPTLHHVLPFSHRAAEIHVADLLPGNLDAIRRWQSHDPGAHDWREFTRRVLRFEGLRCPTPKDIRRREAMTRAVISRRIVADARHSRPLGALTRQYGCVVSCYCADSATAEKQEWLRFMHNIAGLVSPGGLLLVAALRRCKHYAVGDQKFPSAHIDEHDLASACRKLDLSEFSIEVADVSDRSQSGFDSILLASATKNEMAVD
jgi:NNMT/PNMT/TEMT family